MSLLIITMATTINKRQIIGTSGAWHMEHQNNLIILEYSEVFLNRTVRTKRNIWWNMLQKRNCSTKVLLKMNWFIEYGNLNFCRWVIIDINKAISSLLAASNVKVFIGPLVIFSLTLKLFFRTRNIITLLVLPLL